MYINFSHKITEKLQAYFYYVYMRSCKIFLRLLKGNMSENSKEVSKFTLQENEQFAYSSQNVFTVH